eukprot:TRINITY_DN75014_c0_g1_i1.p2 TRINITY_DN75014_c0_g1~~TRINITY_DN75014_c0_g1_i1.p2  ORF type:complete len:183 (-),score=35.75 TRINITY_DN75014_c0_g1_i1:372-920(-)
MPPLASSLLLVLLSFGSSTGGAGSEQAGDQRLVFAAGEGKLKEVRALLAEGVDVNTRSEAGESPLHVAGIYCAPGVVEALLEAKAEVNVRTNEEGGLSMTPLHWYVNMNPCGIHHVRLLLEARADQSLKNSRGETPLDMVSRIENRQHIAALLQDPQGQHHKDPPSRASQASTEKRGDGDEL